MTHATLRGRRRLALLLATTLVSLGAIAGTASAATKTFTNSSAITIPDSGPGSVYPSTVNVSGFTGNVQKVTATIRGFTHTHPDDVAVLLVGPAGTNTILMGRSGGSTDVTTPIDVTFDQAATSGTPDPLVAGTFRPTLNQNHTTQPLSAPAPGGPYTADLNLFNGTPANGTWQLYVDDQAGGDVGTIDGGWSLTLSAPVNTETVGKPKLNKKNGTAKLPVTVGDSGNVALSGKGVATVASARATKSVAVGGPGTVTLKVKPKGKTQKKLNSTGKATVKVKVTFTPTGGTPNVQTKKIKLKKTLG